MKIKINGKTNWAKGSYVKLDCSQDTLSCDGFSVQLAAPLPRNSYWGKVLSATDTETEVSVELYAHLHGHSDNSLLDGLTKVKDYVKYGTHDMALTDHGVLYGMVDFYKQMKKAGKKAIIAFEAYVEDPLTKKLDMMHLCLFAKDLTGYHNLLKLCSLASDTSYRGKPHVTDALLRQYHEGVVASAACLGGPIQQYLLKDDVDSARKIVEYYCSIFGKENFFLEVQRHHIPEEPKVERYMLLLSEEYGLPIIATTDSHYTHKDEAAAHEVLLCLQTGKTMAEKHMQFEGDGYWIHTSEEVEELFSDHPEWLDNTLTLAAMCDVQVPLGGVNLPHFDIPAPFATPEAFFDHLCREGYKEKFGHYPEDETDTVYRERYDYELAMIKQMGFVSYFLVVQDYIDWARKHDIYVGPGRGSAAGSLIAYCVGITDLDPIKLNLLFERFLNPERVSWPDVDTDFEHSRREEVINYVKEKYGHNNVCRIVTFGTMAARMAIRDVARVLGYPNYMGTSISKLIPEEPHMTIDLAMKKNPELKNRYDSEPDVKKIIDVAKAVEGSKRHASQHACFEEGTMVTTSTGVKPIESVTTNDLVLTHKNRFKPVEDTVITETDLVYTVSFFGSHPIRVTGNHPLYVRHQSYKRIRENGKRSSVRVYNEPEWLPVEQLDKDCYVGIPINQNAIIPHIEGLDTASTAFWWIIGRYLGDGWTEIYHRKELCPNHTERRIIICCGKQDTAGLANIEKNLQAVGISYRMETKRTGIKIFLEPNPTLYEFLQTCGKYAYGKRLPQSILDLPVDLGKAFLDGYLSADGHYAPSTRMYSLKTVSKELAMGLSLLINKVYHRAAGYSFFPAHTDTIEGRIVQAKDKYQLTFMPEDAARRKSFFEDDMLWVKVKDIQTEEKHQKMYNLTVLDDSSYQANGLAAHNCGVVLSPSAVDDYLPTSMLKNDETGEKDVTSQVVMSEVEELSLLKMDFLGLKNMGVIHFVMDTIRRTRPEFVKMMEQKLGRTFRYQDIPLTDRETYKMLSKGMTAGVFQLESPGMTDVVVRTITDLDNMPDSDIMQCFENLIAAVALYRPGPMDYIDDYVEGSHSKNIQYDLPEEEDILKSTYGVIVYQEQVMQLVQKLAGFSMGRADVVRKAMGKKKQDVMDAEREVFLYGNKAAFDSGKDEKYAPGCVANGIDENVAKHIWEKMENFAKYAFNRSHAACYAYIAYLTAYMSCHWKEEFYCGMLNAFIEISDKLRAYLTQAYRRGIEILPPDINKSDKWFSVEELLDENGNPKKNPDGSPVLAIRCGLKGLKSVGKMADEIIRCRGDHPFESYYEFYHRCDKMGAKINRGALESLIYSGALNCFGMKKAILLAGISILDANSKQEAKVLDGQCNLFDEPGNEKYRGVDFDSMDSLKTLKDPDKRTLMEREKDSIGFYLTAHPMDDIYPLVQNDKLFKVVADLESSTEDIKPVKTAGIVKNIRQRFTKNNEEMYSFTLEDKFGSINCVIFPRYLPPVKDKLQEGVIVQVTGEMRIDDNFGNQIIVDGVLSEESIGIGVLRDPITIEIGSKNEQMELLDYIHSHPGHTPVILRAKGKDYPIKPKLSVTPETLNYLMSLFKVSCAKV